ncbi:MAG: DMT family transporter [Rhodospirillales bacterium]
MKPHHKGLLLTGSGVLLVSPDALFIRLIDVPPLDLLFWRGLMLSLAMCSLIVIRERRDMRAFLARFSWVVVVAAAISVAMYFFFINAITHTSAANALAILAATPLFAAIIGRVFYAESLSWFTWAAAVAVFVMIAFIVRDSLASGGGIGVFSALGAALSLASFFTLFRLHPDISRLQVFAISGAIAALVCYVMATPFDFDQRQITLTLILTIVFLPAATFLMTLGPRYLPAAEASLLILLESVFGPLWVFLVIGEIPSNTTLACGGAILVCVAWHSVMVNRRERRLAAQAAG